MITGWDGCEVPPTIKIEIYAPTRGFGPDKPVGTLYACQTHKIRALIAVTSRGYALTVSSTARTTRVSCGDVIPPTQEELIDANSGE